MTEDDAIEVVRSLALAYSDERASQGLRNVGANGLPEFFNTINQEIGPRGLKHAEFKRIRKDDQIIW